MADPRSLVHQIAHWASHRPDQPALHGKDTNDRWYSLTWSEYWRNVQELGAGLMSLGHQEGECVAIVGANHPQWVQYQFAIQSCRGLPAPIYPTNTIEQMGYIVDHSQAKIAIVDSKEQLEKLQQAEANGHCQKVDHILSFFEMKADDERLKTFEEVRALGRENEGAALSERVEKIQPDDVCMLIYTSGTTGNPKGVQLTHKGQLVIGRAVGNLAPQLLEEDAYHVISYLPLSHQAEQLLTNVATLMAGGQAYFCPEIPKIRDFLVDVRPTVFLGMPRVWEKFEAALKNGLSQATGIKAKLAAWAMKTEYEAFETQSKLRDRNYTNLQRKLARKLVVDKVKSALGLDRIEVAITGSAPIDAATQKFFASLGLVISEAYGLTEGTGVATLSDQLDPRFGTVGKALDGIDIRISDEGEIQLKGDVITPGYLHQEEASKDIITEDGWLKTGDVGELLDDGNLKITGRIKEILITAGGKNIAPIELENYMKRIDGVAYGVVVGDRKPYLSALIALDPEALDALKSQSGASVNELGELAVDEKVKTHLAQAIENECNSQVARYQTIKKIRILEAPFTIDGGEITATTKVKRRVVYEKFASDIDLLYADSVDQKVVEVRSRA